MNNVDVLQRALGISNPKKARRAAEICKADLASGMVYEFPDFKELSDVITPWRRGGSGSGRCDRGALDAAGRMRRCPPQKPAFW